VPQGIFPQKEDGEYTGKWLVDIVVKGQRFTSTQPDWEAAKKWRDHCRREGMVPPVGNTFREVAEKCLAYGGPNKKWRTGNEQVPKNLRFALSIMPWVDKPIDKVTTDNVEDLIAGLRKRPVLVSGRDGGKKERKKPRADSTINRYLDGVSAVFTYAFDLCRPRLVHEKLIITKFEEIEGRLHWIEVDMDEPIHRWLSEHTQSNAAWICYRFLVATGLRRGEYEAITPEQIRHDYVKLYADQTKGKGYREAFLPPELAREMRALIATGARPRAYLLARTLKKCFAALRLPEELRLHSLRHTCAARMIDHDVNLREVQVILGHKHYKTTERYAQVRREKLRGAAQKVFGISWENGPERSAEPTTDAEKLNDFNRLGGDARN
jgi:integrase